LTARGLLKLLLVTTNTTVDEAVLLHAFERAHVLLRDGKSEPDQVTVRALEEQLRPGASLREVRDVMVPLLDMVKLHGLAAAWDTDMESLTAARVIKRAERWLTLGVPELAVDMLSRAVLPGVDITFLQRRTIAATEADMADRSATYQRNLAALKAVQPLAAAMVARMERNLVVMRPMGAGVAQRNGAGNGGGAVQVTLQAVTPDEAMSEARSKLLAARVEPGITCIVGATDGTYLSIALAHSASVDTKAKQRSIALCDVNATAVRGLLEVRDVSDALADGRLRIYAGIDLEAQLLVDFSRPNAARAGAIVGNCVRSHDIVVRVRDRVAPRALAVG